MYNYTKFLIISLGFLCTFYLSYAQMRELIVQTGHTTNVQSVAFSPDGRYIVTGSLDNRAKLWDVATGMEVRTFKDTDYITSVAFSPDGRYILTGSFNKTAKLWDVFTGLNIRTFRGHLLGSIESVVFSPCGRYILTGSFKRTILWNLITGIEMRTFEETSGSVAFSPDGQYVLAGSFNNTAKLWDIDTGMEVLTFKGHTGGIESVAISTNCQYVLTGSRDSTAILWDITSGRMIRSFRGHKKSITSVAFSRNGKYVLTGSDDDTAKLWDISTGKELRTFGPYGYPVLSVAISPDDKYVLFGTGGAYALLQELNTGVVVKVFRWHSLSVETTDFKSSGRYVLTGSVDHTVKIWDLITGKVIFYISMPAKYPLSAVFSPDGQYILTRSHEKIARLWKINTEEEVQILKGHSRRVSSMTFSPNGKYILTGSDDCTAKLWDFATGVELHTYGDHTNRVVAVSFSPDGNNVFTLHFPLHNFGWISDMMFKTYDLESSRELYTQTFKVNMNIVSVAISPDCKYILTGSNDGTVKLWDISSGLEIHAFKNHKETISSLTFSPDGRYILTGSYGGTIRLWDVITGVEVGTFNGKYGHLGRINSLDFSHDCCYILTGSKDGTAKLWDIDTRREIASLVGIDHTEYITYTKDHYYTCSKGALKGVAFRIGNRIFPFEQFDLIFNRPDIVMDRLGQAETAQIEAYYNAYLRRLRKMGFKEEDLSVDMHLPELKLDWKSVPASTEKRNIELNFIASDEKYFLDRINIFVNDVPVFGVRGINLRNQKTQKIKRIIPVELSVGTNKIQVSVHNEKGVESLKETVYTTYTGPSSKPNLYIIAIGVGVYKDGRYNLEYTSTDAMRVGSLLSQKEGSRFGKVHVKYILDTEATKENIVQAKDFFKDSQVDDMAIVFVAGHGLIDKEYNYYFGTYDVDHRNPAKRGLPYEEIDNLLDGIPARKKVLFLDTCFSGEIDETEVQLVSAELGNADVTGSIRKRSFTRSLAVTQKVLDNAVLIQQDMFADLRRGTGAVVISSSGGGEYSVEGPDWQGGVFTYAVVEGLEKFKADTNRDRKIQVNELQTYILDRVKELTHGEQHPTVRQENLADDFVVY